MRVANLFGIAGLVLAVTGCVARSGGDSDAFHRIQSNLDSGGTFQEVVLTRRAIGELRRFPDRAAALVLGNGTGEQPSAVKFLRMLKTGTELFELSGIGGCAGWGASSLELQPGAPGVPAVFRNRMFLLNGAPETHGFLQILLRGEARPLGAELENLPENTVYAVSGEFQLGAALRFLLKHSESKALLARLPGGAERALKPFLDGLNGNYTLLICALGEGGGETPPRPGILLLAPDGQGKFASALATLAKQHPAMLKVEGDNHYRIELPKTPEVPAWLASPVILTGDGQISLYSSPEALANFAANSPRLRNTPEFQRLTAAMPLTGNGFAYAAPELPEWFRTLFPGKFDAIPLPVPTPAEFAVWRNAPGGTAVENRSGQDIPGSLVQGVTQLSLVLIREFVGGAVAEEQDAAAARKAVGECRANLENLRRTLAEWAKQHGGKFPVKNGADGLRELLAAKRIEPAALLCPGSGDEKPAVNPEKFSFENTGYVYFGGFSVSSNPKLPLLADWPANHPATAHVLLVGGEIVEIPMDDRPSCKKLIAGLQSKFRYSEADFRRLFADAEQLDRMYPDEED